MNYFLNPERNELFFADKVVLVEGQTEKMLFQAWANHFYRDDIALLSQVTYIDCVGKFNFQQFIKVLGEFQIPFVAIYDTDSNNPEFDPTKNIHIKRAVSEQGGKYFELDPDFEGEFKIEEEELGKRGQKKHKPYYAFTQFFEVDGTPKEEQLKFIEMHPKLRLIFKEIYQV
ncbi:MAG: ATP-dependent endonuclease [Candidatus Lokiarchaeota archaeon]|nr:ATP-dependent endonuclease [Candidatus Lokiarchaeota archaeon]